MNLRLTECPRDAMQGWHRIIPTEEKTAYLNQLLKVGFDTLDFGSFVSPKAIPQMADTAEVLAGLDLSETNTKLLAIVANARGAADAVQHAPIRYLGFPFSISETFQQRNTNSSIAASVDTVKAVQELCVKHNKELLIYISMGFGNPYGDPYSPEIAAETIAKLSALGIRIFAMSDTVGVAEPDSIRAMFSGLHASFPELEFGAHLHSTPDTAAAKIEAALDSGCLRFDSALNGIGGCPMAQNDLVGNLATEIALPVFEGRGFTLGLNQEALQQSLRMAAQLFT